MRYASAMVGMVLVFLCAIMPLAFADQDREDFYDKYDKVYKDGRYSYVESDSYHDSYTVEYNAKYTESDYGTNDMGYATKYVTSDYGDEYSTSNSYSESGYSNARYVKSDYGDGNANIWSTHYVSNDYGSSYGNRAGIAGSSFVKSGYGSGKSVRSYSDSGRVYVYDTDSYSAPIVYGKKVKNNKYETYYIASGSHDNVYDDSSDYKVKVYKVRVQSYAYDDYPFN